MIIDFKKQCLSLYFEIKIDFTQFFYFDNFCLGYGSPSTLAAQHTSVDGVSGSSHDLAAVSEMLVPRHSVKKLVIENNGDEDDDEDDDDDGHFDQFDDNDDDEDDRHDRFGAPPPFSADGHYDAPPQHTTQQEPHPLRRSHQPVIDCSCF